MIARPPLGMEDWETDGIHPIKSGKIFFIQQCGQPAQKSFELEMLREGSEYPESSKKVEDWLTNGRDKVKGKRETFKTTN